MTRIVMTETEFVSLLVFAVVVGVGGSIFAFYQGWEKGWRDRAIHESRERSYNLQARNEGN